MKQYRVYSHSNGHIEFIKTGFSWPAFFFTWIWAFTKKLWWVASLGLAVIFIIWNIYLFENVRYIAFLNGYWELGHQLFWSSYFFQILLDFFTIWYEFYVNLTSAILSQFVPNDYTYTFNIVIMNLCVLTASILYCIFMGLKGNELRQLNLIRNGYNWIDSVQADSVDQATRVYLNKIEK